MKITQSGIPVGGAAGAGVFVNDARIKDGGTATTDGQRVFYQTPTIYTVRSCAFDGSDDQPVHHAGASLIVAGGGHWAVWLSGVGLETSWGLKLKEAAALAMTDAGDLLALISYAAGKGLALYRAGSSTAAWALPNAETLIRYPYPQAFTVDGDRVVWANAAGQLLARGLPAPAQVSPAFDPFYLDAPDGVVWIGYHTNDDRFLLHPIGDASRGYIVATGLTFGTTATGGFVGYSRNAAESAMVVEAIDWSQPLVSLAPVPAKPIGPEGPSLPHGTVVDLAPFFVVDSPWPRGDKARGDTHGMDMQLLPADDDLTTYRWWHAKFDKDGQGRAGELMSIDKAPDGWIHLRADASNSGAGYVDTWTDSRWLRKTMRVGETITIKCERVWYHPVTGAELGRENYTKDMQLLNVWPKYWGGADAGQGRCIEYRYNVERYREFIGDDGRVWGWGDWDYTDPGTGKVSYSRFWLKGGERFPVRLPNCPMPRRVIADPPPPPIPPVPPMPTTDTLKSGAIMLADKPVVSADKRFTLLYQSDGNLVLYGPQGPLWSTSTNGQTVGFCAMQGDGNFVVYDKSTRPRWASHTAGHPAASLLVQNDGNVVIYSMGGPIWATGTVYHPPPVPPLPPPPPIGAAPTLSIRGRQFYDGERLWIPRLVSGLTLLVRTPAEQAAFLDWAVATGFNGVRVFAGALTWAGQTPDGARAALPALLGAATTRGLVVEVTAVTDSATGYDVRAHMRGVLGLCDGRPNVLIEWANEIGHPTQASFLTAEWLRHESAALPPSLRWALGAASTDEPFDGVYAASGGTYNTAHLDRGRPRWNNVRRVREIYAIIDAHGAPAINNEPMGADELDGSVTGKQRWNDPALFFTMGALERAFGTGGVHHSQAGLHAQLPGPVQQQCAESYVAAHAAIESALPGLVGSYRNVGHGGSPLVGARFHEGDGEGVVRAYSFISGDKGATVLIGLLGDAGLVWGHGWRQVREVTRRTAHDGRAAVVLEIAR